MPLVRLARLVRLVQPNLAANAFLGTRTRTNYGIEKTTPTEHDVFSFLGRIRHGRIRHGRMRAGNERVRDGV